MKWTKELQDMWLSLADIEQQRRAAETVVYRLSERYYQMHAEFWEAVSRATPIEASIETLKLGDD